MSKKVFKISGTVFAILTFIILFFPWIYAYCEGKLVSVDMTTTGFGLTEFSAWGTVILILPILVLGVVFSKLSEKTKTVILLGLYLLGSVSLYYAASIGMEWLREISTEYVRPKGGLILYPIFMFLSLLSFYLSYNVKNSFLLNLIGIESCDDIDGAVVIQNGKAVAVVSEYNAEKDVCNCVSASRAAIPLICMVHEQRQLVKEAIRDDE